MTFCHNCGYNLSSGHENFCPQCGTKLQYIKVKTVGEVKQGNALNIERNKGDIFGINNQGNNNKFEKIIREYESNAIKIVDKEGKDTPQFYESLSNPFTSG